MDRIQAQHQVHQLYNDLAVATSHDPDQEVQAWALPIIDAVLVAASDFLPKDDPIHKAIRGLITPEMVESLTEPMRAYEAQIVVGQLKTRIGYELREDRSRLPRYLR